MSLGPPRAAASIPWPRKGRRSASATGPRTSPSNEHSFVARGPLSVFSGPLSGVRCGASGQTTPSLSMQHLILTLDAFLMIGRVLSDPPRESDDKTVLIAQAAPHLV